MVFWKFSGMYFIDTNQSFWRIFPVFLEREITTKSNEEIYENVDHIARKDESPIPPKVNQSESSDHNIDTSSNSAYGVTLGIKEAPMYESVAM